MTHLQIERVPGNGPGPAGGWQEEDLRRMMAAVLAQRDAPDGIWVFAYGALIWEGGFARDADPVGSVDGLVRRYCIWDERNRGTPERRALTLGLEREPGLCDGVAFHIPERDLHEAFWTVWKQEMAGGYYTAEWVPVTVSGHIHTAVTFVADPRHALYAGTLPDHEVAAVLTAGEGEGGTATEYLNNTAEALRDRGVPDRYLDQLAASVQTT